MPTTIAAVPRPVAQASGLPPNHRHAARPRKTTRNRPANCLSCVRGEPIVCTPEDAFRCLLATEMDALILEDVIVLKKDVSDRVDEAEREKHLAQFQLD